VTRGLRRALVAAAEALGHVVAGQLDVHAARPHACSLQHGEELLDLCITASKCLVL